MAQGNKLEVKDATVVGSDTSHTNSISTRKISVEPRLRTIRGVKHANGRLGRRVAAQLFGFAHIFPQGLHTLLGRGRRPLLKPQRHTGGMAVEHRHAVAGSADLETGLQVDPRALRIDRAENLLRLGLELVLFTRNVGYHVIDNVHAADTGVAGTRDGLHRDDRDCGDWAKRSLERRKRNDQANDSAVGVAHQKALVKLMVLALVVHNVEVVEVDSRHNERYERVLAMVFCVGKDGNVGLKKRAFYKKKDLSVREFEREGNERRRKKKAEEAKTKTLLTTATHHTWLSQTLTNITRHIRVESAKYQVAVGKLVRSALSYH